MQSMMQKAMLATSFYGRLFFCWLLLAALSLTAASAGNITGTVFRDFDGDAINDAEEVPVAGVEVEAFDASGSIGTATTAADGTYTITGGLPGSEVRVEFNIPASLDFLKPGITGTNSDSLLSFVTMPVDNTDVTVELAVGNPGQHCQSDPDFVMNCYIPGDQTGTGDVLISFPNTASNNTPAPGDEGLENQLGTTWGLAYQRSSDTLFAGSYLKRHSGFLDGSADGTGAIYAVVDPSDGTAAGISTFLNLNTLFGTSVAGTNPHPTGTDFDLDAGSYDDVGKVSFGDLDISEDELTLWVVNLADRRLYEIPLGTDPANPVAPTLSSQVDRHDLFDLFDCDGDGATDTVSDIDLRPFALKVHDGLVYVGAVCSAESTQDANDMRALVWSFDPDTDTFTNVLDFASMTYSRGQTLIGTCMGVTAGPADWHPWQDAYPPIGLDQVCNFGGFPEYSFTQPMLSDIEFDEDGIMYLGFRDRFGDQMGFLIDDPDGNTATGDGYGDIVRATPNGLGGWTISLTEVTDGTEFFSDDDWTDTSFSHEETSFGGLALRLGNGEFVYSRTDPIDGTFSGDNDFSGGVRWKSTATGATNDQYEVYDPATTPELFGKGNGLGDVEPICEVPPLEIGDRLWCDNGDGVQDPGESGISGVDVTLVCDTDASGVVGDGSDTSATVTSDASGGYLFNASNFTGGIPVATNCELRVNRIDVNGSCGVVAVATTVDASSGTRSDLRDSDGALLTTGVFNEFSDTVGIAFTTGLAGNSDHSLDIGFRPSDGTVTGDLTIEKTSIPTGPLSPGDAFQYQITISNPSTITHTEIELIDDLPPGVNYTAGSTSVTGPRRFQVRDRFDNAAFDNQDGRDDWAGDWVEVDGGGAGAAAGNVTISGGSLLLDDNPDTGGQPSAAREVDLSGFSQATLEFEFATSAGVDAGEAVVVEVSSNGGGAYTVLETFTGITGATTGTRSFDISSFIAANTRIRFRITVGHGGADEVFSVQDVRINYTAPVDVFRVTEYLLDDDGTDDFTGTTYDLTLDQNLASNYFVIVQGSDGLGTGNNGGRGPDESYARLTADPFGSGDLATSSGADVISLARDNAVSEWYGVVTVVECLMDCTTDGFQLLDVQAVIHAGAGTSGADTSGTAWSDLDQVMLMGGFNGPGCFTAETGGADSKVCHVRLFPSGTDAINWTRDGGGASLTTATSTVMVLEWGSGWNVQRTRVETNNGGGGANATGEYGTAAISSVLRDQTWVWGTGHTNDQGVGDAAEAVLVTLGDGVNQNATETTVAVGIEVANNDVDFEVYALSHPNLAVDYRFKADGDGADLTVDVTVDSASSDRMALSYNGLNSTNNAYPRPMFSARYFNDTTVRLERRRAGQAFPAWVQGINFSAIGTVAAVTVDNAAGVNPQLLDGAPPNLIQTTDGFELAPGESMTLTFSVSVDSPLDPSITGFTCPATVDSAEGLPSSDSTFNPAAQAGFIGDFIWFDLDSDGVQDIGEPGLDNVQVNLHSGLSCDTPVAETTVTNSLGFYVFDGLPAGDYCVEVYTGTLPDNFTLTTSGNPLTTTLPPGGNDSTIDFGFSADDCLPDIGFEEDALGNAMFPGQIIDNEFSAYGVTISGTGGANLTMIFDSSNPSGGDPDVGSPHTDFGGPGVGAGGAAGSAFANRIALENVLIISEDGDTTDPDDNAGGGVFTFAFDRDMQMDQIGFLDNGDTLGVDGGEIRLFDSGGSQIGAGIPIPGVGDNGVAAVTSIGGSGVRSVEVELFGSGSIDTFITCGPPVRTASLGDRVWLDTDGDGVQDIGEPGIPNVEVTLYDAGPDLVVGGGDDVAVATALTDAAGLYLFTGLPASTFYVDVTDATVPSGLTISPGSTDPGALVTLAVGDTDLDSDFGYRNNAGTAVIGDTVWADADGDGLLDGGEPGIGGVTLNLISAGVDGILSTGDDVVEDTATTDADGRYLFTGVAPGKYLVDVTDTGGELTGYTLTVGPQSNVDPTLPILVEAGDVYLLADFGYDNASLFMIDDTAWLDLDRDGVLDPGEEGIPGVTVTLLDSAGDVVATAISDTNGDFTFTGLENGDYTILITDAANELADLTTTTSPAAAGQQAVTISGADVSGTNFGYIRPGVIGDRVWSDADSDGVQDPNEVGISGVTVQIFYDLNNDGTLDAGDTVVATAVTDAFGEYLFEQLFPGTYVVSIDDTQGALTGYTHTTLDSQAAAGDQLDSGLTTSIDSDLDNDFGYVNAALPNVSGNVFHDLDRDGFDDGVGEPGIGSVTIALVDSSGNIVARTSTDSNGDYLFPDVPAGDYTVTVTDRDEVLDDYFLTSGLDAIDITVVATDITDIDFGYARRNELGRIGDFVWLDADRDGVQDQSEPGLSNVTLNLFDAGPDRAIGGGDDTLLATTVTDANGGYIFADLPVGNYYVDVDGATVPSGLSATTGTTDPSRLVNLAAGEEDLDVDFGYGGTTNSSALGDRVWVDADSDGLQDPGEVGIEGVTVRAVGPSGSFTTTTGPGGLYLFTGLTAGTYTVTVDSTTLPAGLNTVPTNSPASREFEVPADADILTADFGFDAPGGVLGTIGDTVFLDVNANGVQDGGEEGIEDVTLNLRDSSGDVIATLETDENGSYDFTGLLAGSYTVDVTDLRGVLVGLNLSAGSDPTGTIVLAAGQDFNDADFGYSASAMVGSLGNLVWHDVNGDGNVDAGESGLGGVTLDLWVDVDNNGSITLGVDNFLRTTTTDGNGEYEFRGLIPATYLVDVTDTENVLTGFAKTTGAAGVDNNSQADPYQVTLTTGAPTNVTADFGYEASVPFTLSGTVFIDDNEDALFNGSEAGVTGVPVRLFNDLDGDGVLDPGEPQIGVTTSDGSGDYLFTNLPNGNYIVTVDTPDTPVEGFMQTTQTGTGGVQPATIAGANSVDNDFGFFDDSPAPVNPAAIGDRVWFDVDADGVQDIGEPGIANVTVRLFDVGLDGVVGGGDDVLLGTRITDFSGEYLFPGLEPGTYYVDVLNATVPTGLTLSPGSVDPTAAITVVADQVFLDADFGYRNSDTANAIIGNFVWSDADNDGLQDPGEPGIGGVTVDLIGPGADGILGTGDDTVEDTRVTADDGTYLFLSVTPGEYRVDVTDTGAVLAGYTLTSGPQSNTDPTQPISVVADEVYLDADFGYVNGSLFSISDRTWHDIDGDGIQDPGEPAFENVTVSLLDAGGDVIATAITDSNGDFTFDGLPAGNYTLSITDTNAVLLEYVGTTAPATADELDVTIVAADISGVNFGYNIPGQIGDTVWSDANGNDVQDPGEPGIPGVTVELWLDDGDGIFDNTVDTLVGTQVTDGAGFYLFEQLGQGTYFSSVDDGQAALTGYTPTTPDEEGGANAPGTQNEVTLATSAASFLDADFGYQQPALPNVSGNVFNDLDRDGVDDGVVDVGIEGVTIDLVDSSGVVVATTTTDSNGDYSFLDVSAGDYTVTVTDVDGVLEDFFLTSGLDAIDITVVATDITDIDFGYARDSGTASIGDFVWLDGDDDGVQDGAEPGIGGVDLELFNAGPDGAIGGGDDVSIGTTTTDGNGLYLFEGLSAGTYYVDVIDATVPSGLGLSTGSTDPSSLISLSEGEDYREADFGYSGSGGSALGDFIWYDADSDGEQDPGELGIAGITVELRDTNDVFITSDVTDSNGLYLFTGLAAATYRVVVLTAGLPAGVNTQPTNIGGTTLDVPIDGMTDFLFADWGFDGGTLGSIGDTVFLDTDGDGVQDVGEGGIEGVTLNLLDNMGNAIATAITDENGNYDFQGLPAGTYQVDVTDTGGVLSDLNLSAGSDPTAPIVLASGQDYDLADFPYTPSSGLGTIGNLVWRDTDNSGDVDAGESGVEGVTVDLWLDVNGDGSITLGTDNFLRTETTDENGEYEFNSLPPGDYLVTVADDNNVLSGFNKTSGTAGLDNNSQADPYAVTLTSVAPNNLTADFGYFAPADLNISGTTFFDLDGDGLFEPSIAPDDQDFGVNETLVLLFRDLDGDGELDPTDVLLDSMPSDGSGDYLFTNLPPGDYIVAVDATGTYVDGATQTTQLLTLSVQPVTLVAADSVDNDFGFNRPATAVFATRWRAFSSGGQVVVEWQTTGQANTLGFQLYRINEATDREVLISGPELLPALTTSPQGATYQVVDRLAASVGTHATYLLVETETSGFEQVYGPYTLRIDRTPGQSLLPTQVGDGFRAAARQPSLAMQQRLADHRRAVDSLASSNDLTDTTGILDGVGKVSGDGAMQLLVRSTGLHQVTEQTLADGLGLSLNEVRDAVRSGQLQITWRGQPIAWRSLDEGGRGLVFFGESIDSLFTLDNVYRVTLGGGVTMTEQVSTPVPPNPGGSFRDTLHLEEDVFAATFASRDPELDYWHWRGVFAGHPTLGSTVFDVEVPQVAPVGVGEQLTIYLVGASDTGVEGEHHVEVAVNGQLVGDTSWTGLTHHQAVFSLPSGLLLDGANQITVTGLLDSGAPQSLFYVDAFDVTYDRLYAAQDDTLLADVRSSEFSRTLQGFSSADIAVLDVTNSLQPVWQSGNLVEASGDTFDVTVELRRGSTQLWAGLLSQLPEAAGRVDTPSDLLSSFNGAQYMVIAPTELLSGAQALADYRSAEFTTAVVDLADVMDTFNDGIYDPNALREFLAFMHSNWRVAPDYVVLLGTGNFDYRDLGGLGGNAMPPLMVGTPYGLYASDVRYADVNGDGQPEMSIGRLPVLSNDEVDDYLAKLEAHRASSSGSAPWVSRVLLAADDPDSGGNFSVESDLIDSLLPQVLSRQKVYLGETAVPDARQLMLDAFDDGMALVNYVGHGGLDSFAAEGLLTAADVPGMVNGGRLPLVVSLTCNVARFEVPGFTALGEELVLHSGGGAIAVIAPSGLSLDGEAHQLDQFMVDAAYGSNDLTVGQIHTRILEAYAREGNTYFVGQIYQLLGDPAAPFVRP